MLPGSDPAPPSLKQLLSQKSGRAQPIPGPPHARAPAGLFCGPNHVAGSRRPQRGRRRPLTRAIPLHRQRALHADRAKLQRTAACRSTHLQHQACCQGQARLGFVGPVCASVSRFSRAHSNGRSRFGVKRNASVSAFVAVVSLSTRPPCPTFSKAPVSSRTDSTHATAPVPHPRLAPTKDSTTHLRVTKSSSQDVSVKLRSACRVTLIDEPVGMRVRGFVAFPKHVPAPVSLFSPRPKSPRYHRTN